MLKTGDSFINVIGEEEKKKTRYGLFKLTLIAVGAWLAWKYIIKK